jgi:hypothetical protein
MTNPAERLLYRLKPDFFSQFHIAKFPKLSRFRAFCRQPGSRFHGSFEKESRALENREPVSYTTAVAFLAHVKNLYRDNQGVQNASLDIAFDAVEQSDWDRKQNIWRNPEGWMPPLKKFIKGIFHSRDEMYCDEPTDIVIAADMVVKCIGRKTARDGEPVDTDSCYRRGQNLMAKHGWTGNSYVEWLSSMQEKECSSVMFAVAPPKARSKGKWERVGCSVILPLREDAFARFAGGEVADWELTPQDLQSPSKYVLINALGDPPDSPQVPIGRKSVAQLHCVLYQVAFLTRNVIPYEPESVAIITNLQYQKRMEDQGYRPNGKVMTGSNFPILVFRDYGYRSWSIDRYHACIGVLKWYQAANKEIWPT